MIRTPIRKVSTKQAAKNRARAKTYNEVDHEWEAGFCQGCGQWKPVIDHSHLLSQDDYPDLVANKANIVPHCRDRCHAMWENPVHRWRLLDFRDNMEFIQRIDPDQFNEMIGLSDLKVQRHCPWDYEKFLEAIQGF